jgi:hypothetical protein
MIFLYDRITSFFLEFNGMNLFDIDIDFDKEALEHYQEILNGITCDIHKEQPHLDLCNGAIEIETCCEEFRKKINEILDKNDI